jgi:xylulokinase
MLPGDYIAELSNVINTTISGLSEGIMWNFKNLLPLLIFILDHYGIDATLVRTS